LPQGPWRERQRAGKPASRRFGMITILLIILVILLLTGGIGYGRRGRRL
jgi:flagellar basal body-associated protein FliL